MMCNRYIERFAIVGRAADVGVGAIKGLDNIGDLTSGLMKNIDVGDITKNIDVGDITKNIDVGDITKNIDVGDITKNVDVGDITKNVDVGDITKNVDVGDITKNVDVGDITKNVDVGTVGAKQGDELLKTGVKQGDEVIDNIQNIDELSSVLSKNTDNVTGLGKMADDISKKLDNLTDSFKTFGKEQLDNLKTLVKNNPGKTLGALVLIALGTAGIIMAIEEFNKNNNKKVGIIKSYAYSKVDNFLFTQDTQDIVIEFSPEAKIVDGDKVNITDTDFVPNLNGNEFKVKTILSNKSIVITVPKITKYATKGNLTIKTTQENHIINTFKEGSEKTGKIVGTVVGTAVQSATGTVVGASSGLLKGLFGDYYNYVLYFIYVIIALMILGGIYKLYKTFS